MCIIETYGKAASASKSKARVFLQKMLAGKAESTAEQLWHCAQALWKEGLVKDTAEALQLLLTAELKEPARRAANQALARLLQPFAEHASAYYEKILPWFLEAPLSGKDIVDIGELLMSRALAFATIKQDMDPQIVLEECLHLLREKRASPVVICYLHIFSRKQSRTVILEQLSAYYESVGNATYAFRCARDALSFDPDNLWLWSSCSIMALELKDHPFCMRLTGSKKLENHVDGNLVTEMAWRVLWEIDFDEKVRLLFRNLILRLDPKKVRKSRLSRLRTVGDESAEEHELPDEPDETVILLNDDRWLDRVERLLFPPAK